MDFFLFEKYIFVGMLVNFLTAPWFLDTSFTINMYLFPGLFIVIKTSNCGIDLRLYHESKIGFEKKTFN